MRAIKNTKNSRNKTLLIVLVSILGIVLLAGYGFVAYSQSWWPLQGPRITDAPAGTSVINEQETASDPTYSSDKTKEDSDATDTSSSSPTTKTAVQIGISSASKEGSQFEIRAFATGAIEGDGTCTATLTRGPTVVTGTSKAFIDASTTQCEPIQVDITKLQAGTWTIIVSYNSATHEGTSSALEVSL